MITNPPPYDSAPTFSATHASDAQVAPPTAVTKNAIPSTRPRRAVDPAVRTTISTRPQPSNTSTSQGPSSAPEAQPAAAYATHRARATRSSPARRQLAGSKPAAAWIATAG